MRQLMMERDGVGNILNHFNNHEFREFVSQQGCANFSQENSSEISPRIIKIREELKNDVLCSQNPFARAFCLANMGQHYGTNESQYSECLNEPNTADVTNMVSEMEENKQMSTEFGTLNEDNVENMSRIELCESSKSNQNHVMSPKKNFLARSISQTEQGSTIQQPSYEECTFTAESNGIQSSMFVDDNTSTSCVPFSKKDCNGMQNSRKRFDKHSRIDDLKRCNDVSSTQTSTKDVAAGTTTTLEVVNDSSSSRVITKRFRSHKKLDSFYDTKHSSVEDVRKLQIRESNREAARRCRERRRQHIEHLETLVSDYENKIKRLQSDNEELHKEVSKLKGYIIQHFDCFRNKNSLCVPATILLKKVDGDILLPLGLSSPLNGYPHCSNSFNGDAASLLLTSIGNNGMDTSIYAELQGPPQQAHQPSLMQQHSQIIPDNHSNLLIQQIFSESCRKPTDFGSRSVSGSVSSASSSR